MSLQVCKCVTRRSLSLEVGRSFKSERVCQVLEQLFVAQGVPAALRMDNGPEFIALALQCLCHHRKINAVYIESGRPWQNGFAESFHARLRDEFKLYETFDPATAKQIADRTEWHFTPKHGSWLNMAEIELSVLAKQCLSERMGSREHLTSQVTAWQERRNNAKAK